MDKKLEKLIFELEYLDIESTSDDPFDIDVVISEIEDKISDLSEEFSDAEYQLSDINNQTEEYRKSFEDYIDDEYGSFDIGNLSYYASTVLKNDEVGYEEMYHEHYNNIISEKESILDECEKTLDKLEDLLEKLKKEKIQKKEKVL